MSFSKRAVLIVSGGLDSVVMAHMFIPDVELSIISFNYGQRHLKELHFAALCAQRLNAKHKIVNLTSMTSLIATSSLTSDDVPVPEGHYTAETMKQTVVPNRNAIMLSIAFGHAVSWGAERVYTAVHAGDHAIYPDCRPEFIKALEYALNLGNETKIEICAPFINYTKADIVACGYVQEVPFDLTWSCYNGGLNHCGKCGTCVERAEAFHKAPVPDPTIYDDPNFWKEAVHGVDQADA